MNVFLKQKPKPCKRQPKNKQIRARSVVVDVCVHVYHRHYQHHNNLPLFWGELTLKDHNQEKGTKKKQQQKKK